MKLAACVMPTRGRCWLAKQALQSFLSQTYESKMLLILDDADQPSFPGWPERYSENGIYYHRIREVLTIPQKRNRLTRMAPVDSVICNFDSDDWSAPERLDSQMRLMQESGKPFVGFHSVLFYEEQTGRLFKYCGAPNYALGTSFCFTREWGIAHPYPENKPIASDTALVTLAASERAMLAVDGGDLIVARAHRGNTSLKPTSRAEFRPMPSDALPKGYPI